MGKDNNEILNELIAKRDELDSMIKEYSSAMGELSTTAEDTDLLDSGTSDMNDMILYNGIKCKNLTVVTLDCNNSPIINIDNSIHVSSNYHHEPHVNTTLGMGDNVISTIGGLLKNLFD